jgi:hypothetical protein
LAAELKRPRDLPAVINTPVELHGGHLPRHGEAFYEGAWTTLTKFRRSPALKALEEPAVLRMIDLIEGAPLIRDYRPKDARGFLIVIGADELVRPPESL